jgi:hypothetical protein
LKSAPPSLQYDCFAGTALTKNLAQKVEEKEIQMETQKDTFSAIRCNNPAPIPGCHAPVKAIAHSAVVI